MFTKNAVTYNVASDNPKLIFEPNPERAMINSFGMRDDEMSPADMKDRYKIAAIGDSHTYSIRVKKRHETIPSRIEYYLQENLEFNNTEVLNFGVPGYNTAQELEVLKSKASPFDPDMVILQNTANDIHSTNYIQPKYKKINTLIHQSQLLVKSWKRILYSSFGQRYLYDWIGQYMPDALLFQKGLVGTRQAGPDEIPSRQRHPPRTKDRIPQRYHYMLGEENWDKHVREFARFCKQNNYLMLATGFIDKRERTVYLSEGFNVYSYYDIFENKDMKDYGYDPLNANGHFDARGNDFIGKALANYIQNQYLANNIN